MTKSGKKNSTTLIKKIWKVIGFSYEGTDVQSALQNKIFVTTKNWVNR